jgi:transporter family protein
LVYVVLLGALGVTSKLALRSISWQGLVAVATIAYLLTTLVMVSMGQVRLSANIDLFWAAVSAVLTVSTLVLLYVALGSGEAGKVIPVSAAYPAVTLVLAAIFLGEAFTAGRVLGVLLVIGGVVVLTTVK